TAPVRIAHGDTFRVGNVKLRVAIQRAERAATIVPAMAAGGAVSGLVDSQRLPKLMRGAKLTFVDGARAGSEPLERVTTTIGRASDNDVVLEDRSVSAHHAVLTATESGFTVKDLGSSNGTFVNGERVSDERALANGDLIRFGLDSVCAFELDGAARHT